MRKATRQHRRTTAARLPGPLWLPFAVVWLAMCTAVDDPAPESFPDIVIARPGDTLAVFPPTGDTSVLLARANGLALADDEQSAYVLDGGNYRVHRIDLDGNHLASMGSQGEGPGEQESPVAIRAAEGGGVWVLDSQHQRITRFGPDGALVETANPGKAIGFTLSPVGDGVLAPTMGAPSFLDPRATIMRSSSTMMSWPAAPGLVCNVWPSSLSVPGRRANRLIHRTRSARRMRVAWSARAIS